MLAVISSSLAPLLALAPAVSPPAFPVSRFEDADATETTLELALAWLDAHQDDDGRWDADEYMKHDPEEDRCEGPGHKIHDAGITGLALLAFLAEGPSAFEGKHKIAIESGLDWLVAQQDPKTGRLGKDASFAHLYDHGIGTRALCEAYAITKSEILKEAAQLAVGYVQQARNPYAAWRYDVPPIGDNDTSVTGWMILALVTAQEAGLKVDGDALEGGLAWLDKVSDPATGRAGYDTFGSLSSRTPMNDHYPRETGEAMTGIALTCRYALGQTVEKHEIMAKHAALLRRSLPLWEPEKRGCDMYYWYYGTLALSRADSQHWKPWRAALREAVTGSQRTEGSAKGSWDPRGPWGYVGGRVYATAMMTMCLQIDQRAKKE